MKNEFFKIIPIAYTQKKEFIIDNTILWNDKYKEALNAENNQIFINNNLNENISQENISPDNSDFNTEYFKLKGQYLIMSNEPIPIGKCAYMEIKIYNHPKINDVRHLGLSIGIHKLPTYGIFSDNFCMGNVYYTRPYNAINEFGIENDISKTLYGSREYLSYKVIEKNVMRSGKIINQFIQYKHKNIQDSIDISPPMKNSVIGLCVDMENNLLTITVNQNVLYTFAPSFNINEPYEDIDETSPAWLQVIKPSKFYFAMYTIFPDIEIEGEFNLGRTNLLKNIDNIDSKTYIPLFSLYNNEDVINEINEKINIDNKIIDKKKARKLYNKNLIDMIFKHNNCEQSLIYINTVTNEISETKIDGENIEKIYVGRKFYSEVENNLEKDKTENNTEEDIVNEINGESIGLKKENKSAFNFYSRTPNSIFKLNTQVPDLSILINPIPIDKEIYFEFKCMYAYLTNNYEGIPFYIGLTDSIESSIYNSLDINVNCYFKIALFRKRSSSLRLGDGFKIKYINNRSEIVEKNNGINLLRPAKFTQGEYIGVKIDLQHNLIILYINEYIIAKIAIDNDSLLHSSNINNNNNYYLFFQVEEEEDIINNKTILKDNIAGYIICNFGSNIDSKFVNKNLFNNTDLVSLYDYYNAIDIYDFEKTSILTLNYQYEPPIEEEDIDEEDKKEDDKKPDNEEKIEDVNPDIGTPYNKNLLTLNFKYYSNETLDRKNISLVDLFDATSLITQSGLSSYNNIPTISIFEASKK